MNSVLSKSSFLIVSISAFIPASFSQTLWVPGGTVGNISGANVGIGTSAPVGRLEIEEDTSISSENDYAIRVTDGNSDVGLLLGVSSSDDASIIQSFDPATTWGTRPLSLMPNGGNVGIGTTAAAAKFEIQGAHADTTLRLFSDSYGQGVSGVNTANLNLWASEPGLTWYGAGIGNNVENSSGITRVTTTRGGSYMRLLDNAVSISAVDSSGVDRTAIYASGGNVGIGTTAPPYLLSVRGDGSSGLATIAIQDSSNNDKEWRIDQTVGAFRIIESGVIEALRVAPGGNVGIGTASPTQKLAVNGTIRAKEVIVDTGWADYVFADDYDLAPLSEVEAHIEENGHLPDIPSATDVAAHGVSVGEMQSLLLAKVEELTLHQIRQEKSITRLSEENQTLRHEVQSLKQQVR